MAPIPQEKPSQENRVDLEILTVAVRPRIGGMTSWIEQIASGLSKRGWKVRLVSFSDRLDTEGREGYETIHVPTSPVGSFPIRSLDKAARWRKASIAYRQWRDKTPDPRILLSDGTPGVMKVAAETSQRNRIPWVILTGGDVFAETEGVLFSSLLQKWIRESMNSATRILVDGPDLVEALVSRGIHRNLFRVQPHGVDLSRFPVSKGEVKYFLADEFKPRINLVWHGRLAEHHGPLRFLEIAEAIEGAQARLCGAGEQQKEVEEILARSGKKHRWVGLLPREELGRFLAEAEVGVYPLEKMAGVPTVLLESMAAGLPTLSYPTGAASELIRNGENGFLCRNKADMIGTIEKLTADGELRRRIGSIARKTIEMDWSEEATIKRLEVSLSEVARP